MLTGLAFMLFFVLWALVQPVVLVLNWHKLTPIDRCFYTAGVLAAELGLFLALAAMNGISYGGIWNLKFWFS